MSETDDAGGSKKSSMLVTCGVIGLVLALGGIAVVGVAGYFGWSYYTKSRQVEPAGLLSAVNASASAGKVVCAAPMDAAWSLVEDIPPGGTAALTIAARPANCTFTFGPDGSQTTQWSIQDPPDATETWTVTLEDPIPVVAVADPAPPVDPVATEPAVVPGDATLAQEGAPQPTTTAPTASAAATTTTASTTTKSTSSTTTKPASTSSRTTSTTKTTTPAATTAAEPAPATTTTASRSPAPEPEEAEDEELPETGVLAAVKVEWAKGAKKSTAWNMAVDGKKIGAVPNKTLVATGRHKLKLSASGEDPVECTIVASGGEDIVMAFDPEKPDCP